MKSSYNIFPSDVLSLLSKKSALEMLESMYGWKPKNTKERTRDHINIMLRKYTDIDFDVAITIRNNKTGEITVWDSMGILEKEE